MRGYSKNVRLELVDEDNKRITIYESDDDREVDFNSSKHWCFDNLFFEHNEIFKEYFESGKIEAKYIRSILLKMLKGENYKYSEVDKACLYRIKEFLASNTYNDTFDDEDKEVFDISKSVKITRVRTIIAEGLDAISESNIVKELDWDLPKNEHDYEETAKEYNTSIQSLVNYNKLLNNECASAIYTLVEEDYIFTNKSVVFGELCVYNGGHNKVLTETELQRYKKIESNCGNSNDTTNSHRIEDSSVVKESKLATKDEISIVEKIIAATTPKIEIINEFTIENDVLVKYSGNKSKVIIPKEVKIIGKGVFRDKKRIKEVVFHNNIKSIYELAFYNCTSLNNVCLPEGLIEIGQSVFSGCSSLCKIKVPNCISIIGKSAFLNCDMMEFSEYSNGLYLGNEDNPYLVLVTAKSITISSCEIHPNAKIICPYAFNKNKCIDTMIIPKTLSEINFRAFCGFTSLSSIDIPSNITVIGWRAFENCPNLATVKLPQTITKIDAYAFKKCSSLTNIQIPNCIEYLDSTAFESCELLQYNTFDNWQYLGNETNPYLVLVKPTNFDVKDCKISNKTKIVAAKAFNGCKQLINIAIPDSVISVGKSDFLECINLQSFIVDDGNSNYSSQGGILYNKLKTSILCVPKQIRGSVILAENLESIEDHAFENCVSLTDITILDKVTSVGTSAFSYCKKLENVVLGESVLTIGESAFYCCEKLKSILIPNSVNSIGNYTFSYCNSLIEVNFENKKGWFVIDCHNAISKIISTKIENGIVAKKYFFEKYQSSKWLNINKK